MTRLPFAPSLPRSLSPSLPPSLPRSLSRSLAPLLALSLPRSLAPGPCSLSRSLDPWASLPRSLSRSLAPSLHCSLPRSFSLSLPRSIARSSLRVLLDSLVLSLTLSPPPRSGRSAAAAAGVFGASRPQTGRNHVCQCDRRRRTDRPGSCLIGAGRAGQPQSARARCAAAPHTQIGNYVVLAPSGLLYGVPLSLSRSLAVSLARSLPRSLPPSFACSIARLHLALSPSYSTPSFSPSLYPPLPISLSPPLLSLACSTSTAASQNPQIWRPLLLHHPHLPSVCVCVCV